MEPEFQKLAHVWLSSYFTRPHNDPRIAVKFAGRQLLFLPRGNCFFCREATAFFAERQLLFLPRGNCFFLPGGNCFFAGRKHFLLFHVFLLREERGEKRGRKGGGGALAGLLFHLFCFLWYREVGCLPLHRGNQSRNVDVITPSSLVLLYVFPHLSCLVIGFLDALLHQCAHGCCLLVSSA
jgi:hypothetical protein